MGFTGVLEGWKAADQDIGWAETVSVGIHNVKVVVHGNNTGVLGALKKGRSQNTACNLSICRMAGTMVSANILLDPLYVISEANLADATLAVSWALTRCVCQCSLYCLQ